MAGHGNYTLTELRQMISNRKVELEDLHQIQSKLERELSQVRDRIAGIEGQKAKQTTLKNVRVPRVLPAKNKLSLHQTVIDILSENQAGLSIHVLSERVLASGYRTNSKNFQNVLYQCVYNSTEIEHDRDSGEYKLKFL